jgi:hypothetical protein
MGRGERMEAMRDNLAERATRANEVAIAYINGNTPKIYALNQAYTVKTAAKAIGETGIDWTIFNERAVKRLIVERPDLMPFYPEAKAIMRGFDLEYGKKQITKSITQGILQGKSAQRIATDLTERITTMSKASAIRAARTATTEAENAGRQAAIQQLEEKGVECQKVWNALDESRSREVGGTKIHVEADGQTVGNDETFEVGGEQLLYPGDHSHGASGWNLYNCRCWISTEVTGFKSILSESQRQSIKRVK